MIFLPLNKINTALVAILLVGSFTSVITILNLRGKIQVLAVDKQSLIEKNQRDQAQIVSMREKLQTVATNTTGQSRHDDRGRPRLVTEEHPELVPVFNRRTVRIVMSNWSDAIKALKLPPNVEARLKQLIVERQLSANDAFTVAQSVGSSASLASGRAIAEIDKEIVDLIGVEQKELLTQEQRVQAFIRQVKSMAPNFDFVGVALTSEHTTLLGKAWNEASSEPKTLAAGITKVDPNTFLTPLDQAVLEKAKQILTPQQLEVLATAFRDRNQLQLTSRPPEG